MNPFYEKRDGRIQISISENMSFPAHLHGDVEILYCLSGKIMVTVMEDSKVIAVSYTHLDVYKRQGEWC